MYALEILVDLTMAGLHFLYVRRAPQKNGFGFPTRRFYLRIGWVHFFGHVLEPHVELFIMASSFWEGPRAFQHLAE